jgi:hypothetical protein
MELIQPKPIKFGTSTSRLSLGKITLSCYILENGKYIFTLESIQKAMGYNGKSKNWLFEFLAHINRLTVIEPALLEALSRTILFETDRSVTGEVKSGVEAAIFLEACGEIKRAKDEGFLFVSELKFAKAAEIILDALSDKNILQMIDFATGYSLFRQNHKDALSRYVKNETGQNTAAWIRSFPDAFFDYMFRLRHWTWTDLVEKAPVAGRLISDLVFDRISHELLDKLENTRPRMKYRKKDQPEEYIEHPELKTHLHSVSALLETSGFNQPVFEQLLNRTFPKQNVTQWETKITTENTNTSDRLWSFNDSLRNVLGQKGTNKKLK